MIVNEAGGKQETSYRIVHDRKDLLTDKEFLRFLLDSFESNLTDKQRPSELFEELRLNNMSLLSVSRMVVLLVFRNWVLDKNRQ